MDNIILRSGIIYRNPKPHVASRQAYFPSVVLMDNGEMLASMAIGEAFEAVNLNTYVCRSKDLGETWSDPVPLVGKEPGKLSSNFARIMSLPGGIIVANVVRSNRDLHPDEGLANPENIGMVPTDLLLVRSFDYGLSWEQPELISPPLTGPSFEQCCPVVPLRNGRWLWPTSTWRGWDGFCPNGMKMVALVSHDKGKTWPEYMNVMDRSASKIIFWESKIAEMKNGMLVAVAWTYDEANGKDLPDHYSLSSDGGKTWHEPLSTNIHGETMAIAELPGERLLSVYRRMDKPGLWATVSHITDNDWINENDYPLWGVQELNLTNKSDNMVQDFNELKFGAPCITLLPDNTVYVAFWCYEKMVSNIRWFKLDV
jgi:sialidase-1